MKKFSGLALCLALVTVAAAGIGASSASGSSQPSPRAPRLQMSTIRATATHRGDKALLPVPRSGRAALKALGTNVPRAAAVNKKSVAQLTVLLKTDPTATLARNGMLFYRDTSIAAAPKSAKAAAVLPAPQPLADTFSLHSLPGSNHTVYLDFNGYTLPSGGFWTTNGGMTARTESGFSMDSNYGAFSDAEKTYIQHVWQIVAEKYAAFDIDVTTQDPGPNAYNRNGSGDLTYGDHVVFTNDPTARSQGCAGSDCAGVALVGMFNEPSDNTSNYEPAWVFTSQTYDPNHGLSSPALSANDAAHEIGHTLGLEHDGTTTLGGDSYYQGQGNWFPIMGSGVNAVGQFSKGEYNDANNFQDDLAVIVAHGAPVRADDAGNDIADATPAVLASGTSTYVMDGVISSATDKDVYSVPRTCLKNMTASASGIGEGQALDIELRIFDSGGTQIALDNPPSGQDHSFPALPTGLDASATVPNAAAGTYYVQIAGVGSGDPATNGYSNYGSIGNYHLEVTGCNGALGQAPSAPTTVSAQAFAETTNGLLTWDAPADIGDSAITSYRITGLPTGTTTVDASTTSIPLSSLSPGNEYSVGVQAINTFGGGTPATTTLAVQTFAPTVAPGVRVTFKGTTGTFDFTLPPNPGNAAALDWEVSLYKGSTFLQSYDPVDANHYGGIVLSGFPAGQTFILKVRLDVQADIGNTTPTASKTFTVPKAPSAPHIGKALSGARRGPVTVGIRWTAPTSNGGSAITGYTAYAYRLNKHGKVIKTYRTALLKASVRSYTGRVPAGQYKFRVVAHNSVGASAYSAFSKVATAR